MRLGRLGQLLRVAQQHEGPRGRGDGDGVGEGELAGLVDDQHVDGLAHVLARPEPGGAADEWPTSPASSASRAGLVAGGLAGRGRSAVLGCLRDLVHAPAAPTSSSTLPMTACDRAVTPTRLPASSSARISCAAGIRLAGPGRALHGQHLAVEGAADPHDGVGGLLALAHREHVGRGHDARQQPRGHAALPRQHGLGGVGDGLRAAPRRRSGPGGSRPARLRRARRWPSSTGRPSPRRRRSRRPCRRSRGCRRRRRTCPPAACSPAAGSG